MKATGGPLHRHYPRVTQQRQNGRPGWIRKHSATIEIIDTRGTGPGPRVVRHHNHRLPGEHRVRRRAQGCALDRGMSHGWVSAGRERSSTSGEPILFVPGLGYASWCWLRQVEQLSSVARVLTVDNRGAGRSDKPIGPYSIRQLAEDAYAVLAQRSALPAHIVGGSMGVTSP